MRLETTPVPAVAGIQSNDVTGEISVNHEHPVEGGPNPCPHCPPIPTQASMDKLIAVGFGCAVVKRDGQTVLDGERPPNEEFLTFADAEALACLEPERDWCVVLNGQLHGETYQRQGDGVWILIERNDGFA